MTSTPRLRQRKTLDPCPVCFLHRMRCICAVIPKLNLKTRVSLIIHAKELKRTTNTGRLALQALYNSTMIVRGDQRERVDLNPLLSPEYETYVLYPTEGALEIESLSSQKPVQFLVFDGNWRQASKVNQRHPELRHLPRVKVSSQKVAQYHLRKEHFEDGLSTLEAIALAVGAVEGSEVQESLLGLYQAKLRATLEGRGQKIGANYWT